MDEFKNEQYNQSFAVLKTAPCKENFHESIAIHSQALRQVPNCSAQGTYFYHLRKSKTQAETGVVDLWLELKALTSPAISGLKLA